MNLFILIKQVCSFLWKGKTFLLGGFLYWLGRKDANKTSQIKTQDNVIAANKQTLQTMQQMEQAGVNGPGNKEELLDRLDKGQF